ncbi:MAG: hypothetical protein IH914_07490 [candidate division Zixibacteria bacterium]|nr:hypothetical protein [candidate division Zixibacteria bacterium]
MFERMHDVAQTVPASLLVTRYGIQKRVFWQARFYDHNCRTQESVIRKIEYCHKNPINRSLVDHPENGVGPVLAGIRVIATFLWRLTSWL